MGPVCPFKVGDLVTGKNRSYRRSIYKLVRADDNSVGTYGIVSFNGQTQFTSGQTGRRYHSEFRLASAFEVKISASDLAERAFDKLKFVLDRLNVYKLRF